MGRRGLVHYADDWQNGSRLSALYASGATEYANAETGANPADVKATVYMPSGIASAAYVLTPEEWDKLAKSYCSGLTFSGNYLAAYQRYPAGFQFQFHGISTLPVNSVEVRLPPVLEVFRVLSGLTSRVLS